MHFYHEGRIVLYMGFTKDSDAQHTVYDPLQNGLMKKDKCALQEITKYLAYCIFTRLVIMIGHKYKKCSYTIKINYECKYSVYYSI